MLQVVKRNGKKVAFDENKISAAILKAMDSPSGVYIKNQPEHIAYIIKEKYELVDGCLTVPEKPGLGVEVNDDIFD